MQPFHGVLQNEGKTVANWGLSRTTKPAVYAEPISYGDIQAIVHDTATFPAPVNPVGSIASVTETIVNDGGTMVCLRKLDEVLGLERDQTGLPDRPRPSRLPAEEAEYVAAGTRM